MMEEVSLKTDTSKTNLIGKGGWLDAYNIGEKLIGLPGQSEVKTEKNKPKQVEEFCKVPGKGNLKKDDPNCRENCTVPGKEHLAANDPACGEKCKIPGLEHLNANDPNCAQIPSELPQTGPAEAAAMIIAVVALTSGIAYYMRSRQELKGAKITADGIKSKVNSTIEKVKSKFLKK
jgi:LPXTG-motif cell wall-anchored protein